MIIGKTVMPELGFSTLGIKRPHFTAGDYNQAQSICQRMAAHCDVAFQAADEIVTPSVPVAAPLRMAAVLKGCESNVSVGGELIECAQLGAPAVVVPPGVDAVSLPVRCSCSLATELRNLVGFCDLVDRSR
jgi:Asp-tRNA(Asn)/Glu-tRNA(Gln) amidotransferase A subunit family amidase